MVVVSRSQRKEMGRFMVLSQSPAGKGERKSHDILSYLPYRAIIKYATQSLVIKRLLRMASLLSSFHISTHHCPLPCLKNSSMICSLHVLLRCKHREGLLMSAALIAICRQEKGKVGMRLYIGG